MDDETPRTKDPAGDIVDGCDLRGIKLNGSDQESAVDHSEYARARSVDAELRLDAESDTLYERETKRQGRTKQRSDDDVHVCGTKAKGVVRV